MEEQAGTAGAPAAEARPQPPASGKAGGGWARVQGGEPAAEPERGEELGDDAFAGFSERVESWLVRRDIVWARHAGESTGKNFIKQCTLAHGTMFLPLQCRSARLGTPCGLVS